MRIGARVIPQSDHASVLPRYERPNRCSAGARSAIPTDDFFKSTLQLHKVRMSWLYFLGDCDKLVGFIELATKRHAVAKSKAASAFQIVV